MTSEMELHLHDETHNLAEGSVGWGGSRGGGGLDLGRVGEESPHQSQGLPTMGRFVLLQCKHKPPTHQPSLTERVSTQAAAIQLVLSTESG